MRTSIFMTKPLFLKCMQKENCFWDRLLYQKGCYVFPIIWYTEDST